MSGSHKAHAVASDDWLLEQQLRAEMEAEAWRRLREALAQPVAQLPAAAPHPPRARLDDKIDRGGSIVLKALVRVILAAFGAYLAWIAGMDSGMGEFEVWLATGAGFLVTLSLSMLDPARRVVHLLAETMRWGIILGAGVGALWLALHASSWS